MVWDMLDLFQKIEEARALGEERGPIKVSGPIFGKRREGALLAATTNLWKSLMFQENRSKVARIEPRLGCRPSQLDQGP